MKKHTFVMAVCLLYLVSGLAGTVSAEHTQIVETTNITYINGDWLINDSQNRTNETIVLTGNLVVGFGGNLTFRNVTLMMNCTSDGQYQIEVQNGGTMNTLDLDDDNTTTTDASNITANNSNYEYKFRVRTGANFTMRNSELHECGYGPFLAVDNYGLFIQTDNAIIEYNLISQNYIGVILYSSDAVVSNNTIGWNERTGIHSMIWSNGTIINNLIDSNKVYGINVDGGSNSDPKPANNLIINNKIVNTGQGTTTANAIHVQIYSCPIIKNNEIIDYTEDAVYFGEWCQVTIDNLTINADGGNYGLASSSCRYVTISNCSMNNTSLWDLSLATAYYKMTNCSFNRSKVIFQGTDSNLTVNWFLHTYVNDSFSNLVSNANIRIQDNANGTFDDNFTTDGSGRSKWTALREYFQKDINGDKDGNDPGERINYSPYNLTVSKAGYKNVYASIGLNGSKYITITLEANETVNDPYPIYGYAYLYNGAGGVYNPLPLANAQVDVTWWNVWLNDWQTITTNTIATGQYSVDLMNYTNGGVVFCNATAPAPFNNRGYNWTIVNITGSPGGRQQDIVCGVPYDVVLTAYPLAVPVNSPFGITYEIQDIDGLRCQGYYTFFDGPINISANGSYSAPANYIFNGLASGTPGTRAETITFGLPLGPRWLNVSEGLDLNPYLTPWSAFYQYDGTPGYLKDWDNVTISVTGAGFLWRLEQGWNLISVPANPVQKGGNGIFDSFDALNTCFAITSDPDMAIATRTGGNPSNYWVFDIGMPELSAFPMDGVHGYWLYLSVPGPFVVNVTAQNYSVAGANTINLNVGWNLLGFTHNVSAGGARPGGWNSPLNANNFTDGSVDSDLNLPPRNKLVATWWDAGTQWYQSYVVTPTFPGMPTKDWAYDTTYAYGYWVWTDAAVTVTFDMNY
jgi:parallel beta-helix repeat protein